MVFILSVNPGKTGEIKHIQTVADDIRRALGSDAGLNWRIILRTVYKHRKKKSRC